MMPLQISANTVAPQAWRNGGGRTRELLAWPAQGPWRLRISRADIDADGPFSAFPGVTRWFAVLQGMGVALTFGAVRREILASGNALCFDGAQAPGCDLIDGPTQDLNLMAIGGEALLARAVGGVAWEAGYRMRGLYTTVAGRWRGPHAQCQVPPHTLLWDAEAAPGAWTFTPEPGATANAWWLGFTPED